MRTVGVTSGASVPEVLVRGVLDHLAERGWGSVEEITTAEESLVFSLPRELRPSRVRGSAARLPLHRPAGPRPATSTTPVVTAIVGKLLTSGAPTISRVSRRPCPRRRPMQHDRRDRDGEQQRRRTNGPNRLRRRTHVTASTQPEK